jgi:hypothetical protein
MNAGIPGVRERGVMTDGYAGTAAAARTDKASRRLLIPIDATERSRWGQRYALARHRGGERIDAVLICVAEPIANWQVLRFRTDDEVARFQSDRCRFLLDDAAQSFGAEGIPCRTIFREGEIAFQVLDAAEQLACDEIVLPEPPPRLMTLLSRDTVREILRRQREVPVVTVNEYGTANGVRAYR